MSHDPFESFKATQRTSWTKFAVHEGTTSPPAAHLVRFAGVAAGERVLDVACGTGVVAVTAARQGAHVKALDLTPELLERARENAAIARVTIEFTEGDAEALPYPDASFDVVLSQFGHIFAPRPDVVIAEMLRVLRPGGRIAFTTWPAEHGMGRMFDAQRRRMPPPPPGAPVAAPPTQWGSPQVITERLGAAVRDLAFDRGVLYVPTLSPLHSLAFMEQTSGPLVRLLQTLEGRPEEIAELRAEILGILEGVFADNRLHQHYLMSRAVKRD